MNDRDTFAASALTGLLSNIPRYQLGVIAVQAYDIADEMLRERLRHGVAESRETSQQLKDAEDFVAIRKQFLAWQKEQSVGVAEMDSVADRKSVATPRACASSCSQPFDSAPTTHDTPPQSRAGKNVAKTVQEVSKCTERENDHDAAPDARARDADRVRTDKATTRPGNGTGNTPSEAEIDALEFVVEEGRTASVDDYGILRSWLIRLRPEWESQSYEESDEKRVNTTTNRDATQTVDTDTAAHQTCPHVRGTVTQHCSLNFTLSDEEWRAIEECIKYAFPVTHPTAATLRTLLERLK